MKPRRFVAAWVAAALLLITLAPGPVTLGAPQSESVYAANRIPDNGVAIAYRLGVDAPNRSLYRVDIDITGIAGTEVSLVMPAWAPGAYRIADYARNVQAFTAVVPGGRALDWQKTDKQTWSVRKAAGEEVRVSYEVYSNALTPEMGDLAGPETFMYVEGHKHVGVSLTFDLPDSWQVHTGLGSEGGVFRAPDYDVLIDAPAFLGTPRVLRFDYGGEPYRLVLSDPDVGVDADRLVSDVRAIVDAAVRIFGSTPFDDYTFLIRTVQGSGASGLEHLNSTRIQVGRQDFGDRDRYERFLYVVAHEFFHVWNVKWIRPDVLGPFDYTREVHTPLLWVSEGITSYYGRLLLVRAGLISRDRYLGWLAGEIATFQEAPGRFLMSNEEASWNAWLSSDNGENNSISYYTKGEIAGLLFDLEIRGRTDNRRSLDDVMRYLMEAWAAPGLGVPEDGFLRALETVSGTDFDSMYAELARGRSEPDYGPLAHAGLRLASDGGDGSLYMGVRIQAAAQDRPRITSVVGGSPAEAAGLARGDVLLTVGGRSVTMDTLTRELNRHALGDAVPVTLGRGGQEIETRLIPIENPLERWMIEELPGAGPAEEMLREAWLAAG